MPFTVTADPRHLLDKVMYFGAIVVAERLAAMQQGSQLLAQTQYRRVMVDLSAATIVPETLDRGNAFAARPSIAPSLRNSRLAYVVQPHAPANRVIEAMASARHLALRRFHDEASAVRWLLEDGGAPD